MNDKRLRIINQTKKTLHKYEVGEDFKTKYYYNQIIFNKRCLFLSNLNDFDLFYDSHEYLRKYYLLDKSIVKLEKIIRAYTNNQKLFPNYLPLYTAKYLNKNICSKQQAINKVNQEKSVFDNNSRIFSKKELESILNYSGLENLNSNEFPIHNRIHNEKSENSLTSVVDLIEKINHAFELKSEDKIKCIFDKDQTVLNLKDPKRKASSIIIKNDSIKNIETDKKSKPSSNKEINFVEILKKSNSSNLVDHKRKLNSLLPRQISNFKLSNNKSDMMNSLQKSILRSRKIDRNLNIPLTGEFEFNLKIFQSKKQTNTVSKLNLKNPINIRKKSPCKNLIFETNKKSFCALKPIPLIEPMKSVKNNQNRFNFSQLISHKKNNTQILKNDENFRNSLRLIRNVSCCQIYEYVP